MNDTNEGLTLLETLIPKYIEQGNVRLIYSAPTIRGGDDTGGWVEIDGDATLEVLGEDGAFVDAVAVRELGLATDYEPLQDLVVVVPTWLELRVRSGLVVGACAGVGGKRYNLDR